MIYQKLFLYIVNIKWRDTMYIIKTNTNTYLCEQQRLATIKLHLSDDMNTHIHSQIDKLDFGETIQFPNNIKVIKAKPEQIEKAIDYVRSKKPKQRVENVGTYIR